MTRTGKIARLPHPVREKLNRRLLEGEPGPRLLAWLNDQARVKTVLAADFDGRPINAQNLSEWRLGGYAEWCRHREAAALVTQIREEGGDLEALCGGRSLADRLTEVAALALHRQFRAVEAEPEGPEKLRGTLRAVGALVRLRGSDCTSQRERRAQTHYDRTWQEQERQRRDAATDEAWRAQKKVEAFGRRGGLYFESLREVRDELYSRHRTALPAYLTTLLDAEIQFEAHHEAALAKVAEYARYRQRGETPDEYWFRQLAREGKALLAPAVPVPAAKGVAADEAETEAPASANEVASTAAEGSAAQTAGIAGPVAPTAADTGLAKASDAPAGGNDNSAGRTPAPAVATEGVTEIAGHAATQAAEPPRAQWGGAGGPVSRTESNQIKPDQTMARWSEDTVPNRYAGLRYL